MLPNGDWSLNSILAGIQDTTKCLLSDRNFSTNAQNPEQTAIKFSLPDTPISSEHSFTFPVSRENDPRAVSHVNVRCLD